MNTIYGIGIKPIQQSNNISNNSNKNFKNILNTEIKKNVKEKENNVSFDYVLNNVMSLVFSSQSRMIKENMNRTLKEDK